MPRLRVCLLLICAAAVPTCAQELPAWEVSGGYTMLDDRNTTGALHGWVASITSNITPLVRLTAEAGGSYQNQFFGRFTILPVLFGIRFAPRTRPRVTPFAQFLIGPVFAGVETLDIEGGLQAGAGIDLWFNRSTAVRMGGDYRRVFAEDEHSDQWRLQAGLVLGIGK
jgi:hypothetical protein